MGGGGGGGPEQEKAASYKDVSHILERNHLNSVLTASLISVTLDSRAIQLSCFKQTSKSILVIKTANQSFSSFLPKIILLSGKMLGSSLEELYSC